MKLTKEKLMQLINEELEYFSEADSDTDIAAALKGKAGLPKKPFKHFTPYDTTEISGPEIDIGGEAPDKESLIKAAMLLNVDPDSGRNRMAIYNVAMYLKQNPNPSKRQLQRVTQQAHAEDKLVGGDEPLEETLVK